MATALSLPHVTRVEVIDPNAQRAFVGYYEAGASVHVQDEGRTIKVFAGETQPDRAEVEQAALNLMRDVIESALTKLPALLDNPGYGGDEVTAIADALHAAWLGWVTPPRPTTATGAAGA